LPPFAATGKADSYFDVFVEFLVGGQVYHPAQPLHMQSVITHKPPAPGETYVNPFTQPIELLGPNGEHTGVFVVNEIHTPNPTNCVRIVCPSNIVVGCVCNVDGAKVTYAPTATNVCGGAVTVTCTPPSGSNFPVGTTTVTCTASDSTGSGVSCSFLVTVNRDT